MVSETSKRCLKELFLALFLLKDLAFFFSKTKSKGKVSGKVLSIKLLLEDTETTMAFHMKP